MSSFADVQAATCRIVDPDGRQRGCGFFVLPDGHLLTCHHVIAGANALFVQPQDSPAILPADYLQEHSDPEADIAVLQVQEAAGQAVGLGRLRTAVDAYGYGYRPTARDEEPQGHTFPGRLDPGQQLQLPVPASLQQQVESIDAAHRRVWNRLPVEFRTGEVCNFSVTGGLEQGVSGGPVYDRLLRRVVGLMRAVEGEEQAYVIPLNVVFTRWADLAERNDAEVRDEPLDQLAADYGVTLVAEGARPVHPTAWRSFQSLFDVHRWFSGRHDELRALDEFAAKDGRSYAFVTGPAGFGKTATLCRWVQALRGPPGRSTAATRVAMHFLTTTVDDGLDARYCFRNLCEQLMELHGLGGELPGEVRTLRYMYADLLRLAPPETMTLAVVIDGVDEVLGRWSFGRDVFPQNLPANVHVVFSAREMADKDWLADLGLRPDDVTAILLDRLDRGDVVDVLVKSELVPAGAANLQPLADRIFQLSDGDPFYVQDLLHELEMRGADLDQLRDLPVGHSNYLRGWWRSARAEHAGQGFVDLMGTLACLRAPLRRAELVRVSPDDELRGADIDLLLATASRYIDGDERRGYQLGNSRVRIFLQQLLEDEIGTYRDRLAGFCRRWDDPSATAGQAEYGLRRGIAHLLDVDRPADAIELLTPRWISQKWTHLGSHRSLVEDLQALAGALADRVEDPLVARFPALVIARETVRELIGRLPSPLLRAWLRLDRVEPVLEILATLGEESGYATEPLIAVAGELLEPSFLAGGTVDPAWSRSCALDLLSRAIGMLTLERSSLRKLEHLEEIVDLLERESFPPEQLEPLVAQTAAFCQSVEEPTLRACVLGQAARLAAGTGAIEPARTLLEQAEEALTRIRWPADRLFAIGSQLVALRTVDPVRLPDVVRSALDGLASPPEASSLGKATLEYVLTRWRPQRDAEAGATWVVPAIERLAELYIAENDTEAVLPSQILMQLSRCGHTDRALELLERAWNRAPLYGAYALLEGFAETLSTSKGPKMVHSLLVRALPLADEALYGLPQNQELFRGLLAEAFAAVGDWDRSLQLLASVRHFFRGDPLKACLAVAGQEEAPPARRLEHIGQLVDLGKALDRTGPAEIEAAAALAIAPHSAEAAKDYLAQAVQHCLATLPEGDADQLRLLQALILFEQNGDTSQVDSIARRCVSPHRRIEIYRSVLEAVLPAGDSQQRPGARLPRPLPRPEQPAGEIDVLARGILDALADEGETLFPPSVIVACEAALLLAPTHRTASAMLCDAARRLVLRQVGWAIPAERVRCLVAETRARIALDREAGLNQFAYLLSDLGARRATTERDDYVYAAGAMFQGIAALADVDAAAARRLLAAARQLVVEPMDDVDSIELAARYVAATARLEPVQAVALAEQMVAALEALRPSKSGAPHLRRMFAEFIGRQDSPPAFDSVCTAVVALLESGVTAATALLRRLLDYALAQPDPEQRQGGTIQVVRQLAGASPQVHAVVAPLWDDIVKQVRRATGAQTADEILDAAVTMFADIARSPDVAENLAARITDAGRRAQASEKVEGAREAALVEPAGPFELAYVRIVPRGLAFAVLHSLKVEHSAADSLQALTQNLADPSSGLQRYRLLSEFVPSVVPLLVELHGANAATTMVDEIDSFDTRVVEAAQLTTRRM